MKYFNVSAAQGELFFRKIDALPAGVQEVPAQLVEGRQVCVIGHSETGHHHVMDAATTKHYKDAGNPLLAFLQVTAETPLEHLRAFDAHEALGFVPGFYAVHHQREEGPEGWRRVED